MVYSCTCVVFLSAFHVRLKSVSCSVHEKERNSLGCFHLDQTEVKCLHGLFKEGDLYHHVQVKQLDYGCLENEMRVVPTRIIIAERQCARAFERRDMQGAILKLLAGTRSVAGT